MLLTLSIVFIAIGIAFMYVGIQICKNMWYWYAHVGFVVFVIGLCFVCMVIKQLMEVA